MNLELGPPLISCIGVSKLFKNGKIRLLALDETSIAVRRGETLGLVGQSGSGKTTLAKIMAGLISPTSGEVLFENFPVARLTKEALLSFRKKVQFIPQFPDLALDPTWYVYESIAEPLWIHKLARTREEALSIVLDCAAKFGLSMDQLRRKPRDLSGGEVQRAVIARALTLSPDLLIADEPTSMLDPSTRAKIMRQLMDAQKGSGFALVLVSHDIDLVKAVTERACVMLGGKIIEAGKTDEVFSSPIHPYTRSIVSGEVAALDEDLAVSCLNYGSCKDRSDLCKGSAPPQVWFGDGRFVRCWKWAV
ncbi:MAG: ABC transporter ATP-binding protein [Candidatus Methanosuratincola petrocarbonis]